MTDLNLGATITDGGGDWTGGPGGPWDTPSRANDGDPATFAEFHTFVGGPGAAYLKTDLGSSKSVDEMRITAETVSALGPFAGFYSFQHSPDGSAWTNIPLTEVINVAGYQATYTFDSTVTDRYFRIRTTFGSGFNTGRRIATWETTEHAVAPPPVADFSGTPRFGVDPLSVDFTDLSTNTPTSWAWTFGDGGTSTSQNPTHVYTDPGTYTVSLTATNANGSDTETKIGYIVVADVPTGVGVDVYTPGDVFIATLARPQDQTIRLELNGPGSGYFVINRNDVQATAEILAAGNICRVTIPEIDSTQPLFDWIMETGDFDLISSDEEGGEDLAFAGRGSLVDLERALIWDVSYVDGSSWVMADKGVWRFENKTAGYIVRQILQEAVNRGVLPDLIVAFGADTDSDGNAWPTMAGRYEIPIGSNAYEEVLKLVALGQMKIRMDPGFWLRAYVNLGADKTGAFGTGNVRFERAVNIVDNLNRDWQGWLAGTHALVHGEVSYVHAESPAYSPGDVVREVFLDQTNMTADGDLEDAGLAALATRNEAGEGLVFAHLPGDDDAAGLYLPGPTFTEHGKYQPGDLVTLDTGTGGVDYDAATQRVYAVTISRDEAGQLAPPMVELNSPWMGDDEPFAGASTPAGSRIGSPGGSTGGSGGGGGGTGGGIQTAAQTPYDDTVTGLGEDRVQGAIEALRDAIDAVSTTSTLEVSEDGSSLDIGVTSLDFTGAAVEATNVGHAVTVDIQAVRNNEGGDEPIKVHGSMGSTETFDPTDGNVHTGTLNANCTFTLSAPAGTGAATLEFWLTEDGTGGWTVTWPGSVTEQGTHDTTAGTTQRVVLESVDGGTTWIATWIGSGGSAITVKDEGTPLATSATSLDFVGAGVIASGTGAGKTITIPGGAATLDDLTDVVITTPVAGDRLRHNGSSWVNSAALWVPVMVEDGATGLWYVAVTGDGDAVMTEVS